MRNWIMKSVGIFSILLFLISLIPFTMLHMDEELRLTEVIRQVQELQQATEKPSINFKVVFANTITTLKTAAGLKNAIAQQNGPADNEKSQIIISVRLPYLLPTSCVIPIGKLTQFQTFYSWSFIYKSHILTPETPPPIAFIS